MDTGPNLGSGDWTQIGQWILDLILAVETGPNLGSGYWTQIGQWKLDPIWAVDTGPNLGSGYWTQFGQWKLCYTVWKFQDFSVIQILREINLGESRSSETAILTIFRVLNFANWHISAFKKCKNV